MAADAVVGVHDVLNALPYFAMVLDTEHHVVEANTRFVEEVGRTHGECPLACFEVLHKGSAPHRDCPLVESIRTNRPVERIIDDEVAGSLLVSVFPLPRTADDRRLFLHLAQPIPAATGG